MVSRDGKFEILPGHRCILLAGKAIWIANPEMVRQLQEFEAKPKWQKLIIGYWYVVIDWIKGKLRL